MTRSSSPSVNRTTSYESTVWRESCEVSGVRYQIRRMSLARRHAMLIELRRMEAERGFHRAGECEVAATEVESRMQQLAIREGLVSIEGLHIDGADATVEDLIRRGPESLAREIADAAVEESSLSETERKN